MAAILGWLVFATATAHGVYFALVAPWRAPRMASGLLADVLQIAPFAVWWAYMYLALRRVYRQTWWLTLVKTAVHGADPNWGRILGAIGTTAAGFDPDELDVSINGVTVCRNGAAGDDRSKVDLSERAIHVLVDLHAGDATATVWTNDLSVGYVHENSAYSS